DPAGIGPDRVVRNTGGADVPPRRAGADGGGGTRTGSGPRASDDPPRSLAVERGRFPRRRPRRAHRGDGARPHGYVLRPHGPDTVASGDRHDFMARRVAVGAGAAPEA